MSHMSTILLNTVSTMESSFRIAHISDTHVSPEYNRINIVRLKSFLAHVMDENFDHVVITGDVTGQGELRGYRSVRRLLKYFNLLRYDKLSVTIGNHDIFGGVHRAEDLFTFGQHCRTTDYQKQVRIFERAFKETFPRKAYTGESPFPYVKIIGPAAIIGINSVSPFHPLVNPVGSNGQITEDQIVGIERILRHPSIADLKKIVLIHHHFNKFRPYAQSLGARLYGKFESQTLKLYGKKKVEEILRNCGVSVVLHGHTHIEGIYSRSGIMFSSAALNPVREKYDAEDPYDNRKLRFNEISISDDGEVRVSRRLADIRRRRTASQIIGSNLNAE